VQRPARHAAALRRRLGQHRRRQDGQHHADAKPDEVVFTAAATGATNLVATVICHDMAEFYRYLTERISGLDGVDRVESTPLLRHVK
jgi:DNA-binding Lrp family transcriptional regulator